MNDAGDNRSASGAIARIRAVLWRTGARLAATILVASAGMLGLFFWIGVSGSVGAQPVTISAAKDDNLKPLDANAADVAQGKRVAEACAGCHGASGISAVAGVPNLAGQRAVYLYLELKAYQSGARGNAGMSKTVEFLSDDALVNVAAFFASLDPAQPGRSTKTAVVEVDAVQAGKTAAASCGGCHGDAGVSTTPGMPSLAGLDPGYVVAAMKAYKSGARKNDLMKSMLASVTDANMSRIALYFAVQRPARSQAAASGDQAAGKAAAASCSGCHGEQGVSGNPAFPSLAGQDPQYLAAALQAYKAGVRNDATMKAQAALDDGAIKGLAAYFSAQQPQAPTVPEHLTAVQWAQRCDRCHGINGNSTDPRLPALAGQRADYLQNALHDFRAGTRKSPPMAAMSEALNDDDVDKLSAHYASETARAVVYVLVPRSK
jgi:cytochrome c553